MSRSLFHQRWARYGLAVAAVAAGFALRLALTAWVGPGLPMYITFYPAVMAVALFVGLGPGLLASVLTALGVAYWFFEPAGFGVAAPVDRVATVVFVVICLFICEITRRYRRARDEAAAREREQALRESREALRRQAELIDPIRAELIAEEMQRAVRERGEPREASAPTANWLPWVPTAAGAFVVTVGVLVLLGWIFNVTALKSILPGLANMKANTALCFVLTGLALMLRDRPPVRLGSVALLGIVAGATLGEYITGRDFGIDQLLFRDARDLHTVDPGRMVPETAIGFVLSSVSLLLVAARSRAVRWTQQALAAGTALIGLFALLGYLYSVERMYNFAGPASMALLTSVGLLVAAFGLLWAPPDGWARVLAAGGPGAQLARRFLPVALLLPVALGWLHRYGELTGWVEPPLGTGLLALAMMLALLAAVWWISQALNRADAARRETEMQLRNQAELIDRAGEALIVRELGGAICSWNRGAELLYGWSAAEAVGQSIHALLRPEPAALVETIETALAQDGRWDGELAHTTRDGRQLTIDAHKTATRTGGGRVLVLESLRDISARKAAETAVRTHAEALGRSRQAALNLARDATAARARAEQAAGELERTRNTLAEGQNIAHLGSFEYVAATRTTVWSEEEYRIYGLDPAGPSPAYEVMLAQCIHPDDAALLHETFTKAMQSGSIYELEHRIVRPDGSVRWVYDRAHPHFDEHRNLVRYVGATLDITEHKLIEQEREERDRRKDEFLALLGHELRNPLAAISTAMRLLSNGVSAERRDALQQLIDRQVGVLRRMVDDLLDLARITHGHIELQKERLDLSDVLQRASAAVRSSLTSRRQELVVRMPAGYVLFMADSVRMEQIVTNLLSNASKYTEEGGRIELSGAREGSEVVIRCKDNGRGIPLGMQRMIFEPFTRVQKAGPGDAEGVGLGLALVRRLAELHGGTISVESGGAGTGSEFTVRLPLVEPPAEPRETKPVSSRQIRRGLSVVLVEDNRDVVQTMTIALEQAGHQVTVFEDGPSAVSGLAGLKADAILLDIGLPGMDGYELAAKLKERENLQQALYVGLSGYKRRTPAAKGKDDFDEYFVKPVDLNVLLEFLDAHSGTKKVSANKPRRPPTVA